MDIGTLGHLILQELKFIRDDMKEEIQTLCNAIKILHSENSKQLIFKTVNEVSNHHENAMHFDRNNCVEVQQCRFNNQVRVGHFDVPSFPNLKGNCTDECEVTSLDLDDLHSHKSKLSSSLVAFQNEKGLSVEDIIVSDSNINHINSEQAIASNYSVVTDIKLLGNTKSNLIGLKPDVNRASLPSDSITNNNSPNIRIEKSDNLTFQDFNRNISSAQDYFTNLKSSEKISKFRCKFCSQLFTLYSNYLVHLKTHRPSDKERIVQKVCRETDAQNSNIWNTDVTQDGGKKYACEYCNKAFRRKYKLRVHKRIHTGEKPYKCNECGKSFTQMGNLTIHNRIHTGEKPYKCGICSKSFTQLSHLSQHNRLHTGEKPYSCSICNENFTQLSNLTDHVRTHSALKRFN